MFLYADPRIAFHSRTFFDRLSGTDQQRQHQIDMADNELICRHGYLWNKLNSLLASGDKILFILKLWRAKGIPNPELRAKSIIIRDKILALNPDAEFDILVLRESEFTEPSWPEARLYNRYISELLPGSATLAGDNNALWLREIFNEFRPKQHSLIDFFTAAMHYFSGDKERANELMTNVDSAAIRYRNTPNDELTMVLSSLTQNDLTEYLSWAMERLPDNSCLQFNCSKRLAAAGKLDDALKLAKMAVDATANPLVFHHCGKLLLKAGELNASIEMQRRAIAAHHDSPSYHINLSYALARTGATPEAIDEARIAIGLNGQNPSYYAHLGGMLMQSGDIDEAIVTLEKAIELDPRISIAHITLSYALTSKKQYAQAIDSAQKAIELKGDASHYHHHLGNVYLLAGMRGEAAEALETAVALAPDNESYRKTLRDIAAAGTK